LKEVALYKRRKHIEGKEAFNSLKHIRAIVIARVARGQQEGLQYNEGVA
jgi:hypothetical protein